jgi:tetratricopeptide (TPR) repeat protein
MLAAFVPEAAMRKLSLLLILVLSLSTAARAQLVRSIGTQAGTPEDKALDEISNTTDPAQKLALIDKFNADFGKGDLAILGNDLYVSYYSETGNYKKMAEYAQKILTLDPDNFSAVLHLARAESQLGDTAAVFDAGEKLNGILTRYNAQTPPASGDAAAWTSMHKEALADQQDQIRYVQSLMTNALYKVDAPADRAAFAERYVTIFPDSSYTAYCERIAATSYQGAQNLSKMAAAAEKALTFDPNSIDMLLILADYYSNAGQQLDKAAAYAKKAIQLLPDAKAPEGVSADQWQKQVAFQTGIAWSAEGQVLINKNDLAGAAAAFQKASPMLKSDVNAYARNLYRLGFTDARLQKIPEARAALTEAISFNTPFKALAQQTLDKLGPATPPKRTGRGN